MQDAEYTPAEPKQRDQLSQTASQTSVVALTLCPSGLLQAKRTIAVSKNLVWTECTQGQQDLLPQLRI